MDWITSHLLLVIGGVLIVLGIAGIVFCCIIVGSAFDRDTHTGY